MDETAMTNCPLCGLPEIKQDPLSGTADMFRIECKGCREYIASWEFLKSAPYTKVKSNGYLLAGLARERYENREDPPTFLQKNLDEVLKDFRIPKADDIEAKVTKLLKRIKDRTRHYGSKVKIYTERDFPLAYAQNQVELYALIELLKDSGLIDIERPHAYLLVKLTAKGWEKASELYASNQEFNQGFIAIWFDPQMSESVTTIQRAVEEAGFKPMCIQNEHFSDRIMDKALSEIRKSRFIVVDLTGSRPSVFFEAGFAFGLGIEAIYVYKKGAESENSSIEFYVKHYQCHPYSNENDLYRIVHDAIGARIK